MIKRTLSLLLASATLSIASTKSVYRIWQPLSLLGTDVSSVLGKESGVDYAVLMSRPVALSGAVPEDLVYAVALKHKMASIGSYNEPEVNLLVLSKIKLEARYQEEVLTVTIDVSDAVVAEGVEVSLADTVQLTVEALHKTLEDYGTSYLRGAMQCSIEVIGKADDPQLVELQKLNKRFGMQQPEEKAGE